MPVVTFTGIFRTKELVTRSSIGALQSHGTQFHTARRLANLHAEPIPGSMYGDRHQTTLARRYRARMGHLRQDVVPQVAQ